MIEQYTSPVAVNNSQEPWLVGEGVVVSGGVAIPSLDFNFITGGLPGTVTFTRASTATYFNSAGVLTSAAINEARFDYNPSTLAARGLLIEEQRTNSLRHSESLRTQTLTVTGVSGAFTDGETVTATGGGTGTYIASDSTPTSFAIFNGSGTFTGTLTGGTSGETATISASQAEWILTRSTITANATTAPNGTVTADKLVEDTTASNTHGVQLAAASVTSGVVYAASVFVKAAERTWALVVTSGTGLGTNGAYIDLSTGAVGNTSGTPDSTPTVQNCGNGWYRVTVIKTAVATSGGGLLVRLATGNNGQTYTGDGTSGIYVWGAQLEAGAFPTSYIPTTTTALTRSADVASVNTLSPWFNATEGTLFVEASPQTSNVVTFNLIDFNNTTTNNRIALSKAITSGNASLFVNDAASAQCNISSATWTATGKLAGAYAANDFATSYNGATPATDTSGTVPSVTRMQIGVRADGGNQLTGHIRRITYYPRRLSNAELVSITT